MYHVVLTDGHWVQGRWLPDILREPVSGKTNLDEEVGVPTELVPEGGGVEVYSIDEIKQLIEYLESIGEEWDRKRALEEDKKLDEKR